MTQFGFDLDEIQRLIQLVEQRGLARLEIEDEDRKIEIRGPHVSGARVVSAPPKPLRQVAVSDERVAVESPTVGVFYRSASPDAPPIIEAGDHVEVGQVIGMLEAMKVFSEIVSDHAGVVVDVVAKNGALVRRGEVLLYLKQA